MGKGFNNYMCKKFFHPASADNLARVWKAEKKAEAEKRKQDDLRAQYDKEQELFNNKALLSKETKERLEVNFMYEPPPGVKKFTEEKDGDDEPQYKFEWQRTWGQGPRESHVQDGDEVVEQPFGIQVCQARCLKCGAYGHMNIDKRCPLYGKAVDADAPIQSVDQDKLMEDMRADGLQMRYSAWDMNKGGSKSDPNQQYVQGEKPKAPVDRAEVLKSMSKEEKKALLKKLKKMEKEKNKSKKEKKKKRSSSSDKFDSEEERHLHKKDVKRDRDRNGRSRSRGEERRERRRRDSNEEERKAERREEERRRVDRRRGRSRSRDRRERSRSRDRRR